MTFFKKNILLDLFTGITAFFLVLDAFFYSGFVYKHFYFQTNNILIVYLLVVSIIYFFKKTAPSEWLLKFNKICFSVLTIVSLILFALEQYTYPNFVYGHLHININNFMFLIFLSGYIFYLYYPKKLQKHFYFVIPFLSVFLVKKLSFGNDFNLELISGFSRIVLNFFLWFFILSFFVAIFKKRSNSIIGFFIFLLLFSLGNYYKIKSWNQPLSFTDISLLSNAKEFALDFLLSPKILFQNLLSLTGLVFLTIFIKKYFNQNNPKLKIRIKLALVSALILILPITFPNTVNKITSWFKIKPSPANHLDFCRDNGVLFGFYYDLQNIKNPAPENYNQQTISQIYSNINDLPSLGDVTDSNEVSKFSKPNIIIILSEALFDSTQLPITLSQDPIKNIRQDQKTNLISSQFGGGTANIEFELATGLSNYFMNGKVPYSQAIRQDMPTIFTLFKEKGYLTTAIHPYLRSMFNRTSVYKHFGVDKFISIENMSDYDKTGAYVSDKSFTQEILKQFNSTDQPQLIFTLSMQNHFPFEGHRFPQNPVQIKDTLQKTDHESLETYINGIYYSDQAYLQLKQNLQKLNKPTIVLFYGDHLPLLGADFDIYKKLQYIPQNQSEWETDDYLKLFSTPVAIWTNFKTNTEISSLSISPNFLSLEILKLANITPKYQFKFIESLQSTDNVLNLNLTPKFSNQQLSNYQLIQYDLLYGKKYILNL